MHRESRNIRLKLPLALLAACLIPSPVLAAVAAQVRATRLWPSSEYSRITLELNEAVPHKYFSLDSPARLVLDLEEVDPAQLSGIASLLSADDPYIAALRVGSPRAGVARLVVELKADVKPQVFTLKPMGEYGHRLVLDLYPGSEEVIERQMQQAIQQAEQRLRDADTQGAPNRSGASDYKRLITIVIDPGHGGEDPGAIGTTGTREKDVTLSISHLLKTHLDKIDNIRAVLTRDRDYFIPLHERVKKARAQRADLFMSIHADAFLKPTARGSSVFALSESGATSAAAKWLARKENAAVELELPRIDGHLNVLQRIPKCQTRSPRMQQNFVSKWLNWCKPVVSHQNWRKNLAVTSAAFIAGSVKPPLNRLQGTRQA